MHFLSINSDDVRRTSNGDSFGYRSGHKTGCSGPVSTLEIIADYFNLPTLMMSPEFVEDNFDEVDDYDGDSSSLITSNMADRTMRKLSEQNAAGKKTFKIQ